MHPHHTDSATILGWLAAFGAAALTELAVAHDLSNAALSRRLRELESEGLVEVVRLLHGTPALYVITRSGLRAAGRRDLAPPRVSNSGFAHLLECARVAVALQRALGGGREVHSERELRAWERSAGHSIASAELGWTMSGPRELHRPDLVCLAAERTGAELPIAVEVELTVKAPERLRTIVRGWARSRRVAGVVYYAHPAPARALERAVAQERAGTQVHVLPLARAGELPVALAPARSTNAIPSAP